MKKHTAVIAAVILSVLFIPIVLFGIGMLSPAKYSGTYYGALSLLYSRLCSCEENKIVVIGNSAVAFGVDGLQLQQELKADGISVEVCNFGLYGAIGTKTMLELAKPWIGQGDLVILMPELNAQALSLYFSPMDFWYACDGSPAMLRGMGEEAGTLLATFPQFVSEKLRYQPSQSAPGVYSVASFDENGSISRNVRPYNIMPGLVDANDPLRFDPDLIGEGFTDYLNAWYSDIRSRGADMVWYFAPVNEEALSDSYENELNTFFNTLNSSLDFPILGDPRTCVMDGRWFYDSNAHLNGTGMTVYTACLTDALKLYYEKSTPVRTSIPDFPQIPVNEGPIEGDDRDAGYFLYEENEEGFLITGLTDEGKLRMELTVPCTYEGRTVYAFSADTFAGNKNICSLTIQDNIRILYNGSFDGCTDLERVILTQSDPERITVGYHLLDGTEKAMIYVKQSSFSNFSGDYFWGHYAGSYETY